MIFYKKKTVAKKILNSFYDCFTNLKTTGAGFSVFLKGATVFLLLLIGLVYGLYLFFLPNFVDEKRAEDILSDFLSKNTKLSLDIENLKVNPNYKFDINIKADSIKFKYSKDSDFIELQKPVIDINLLTLFMGYLDLNKIKTKKLTVNTTFLKSQKYSAFEYFSPDIFKNTPNFELRNIKINADEFDFNLKDDNINQKFCTKIKNFELLDTTSVNSQHKTFKLSGNGKIKSDNFKIADLNVTLRFKTNSNSLFNIIKKIEKLNYNPFRYALEYKFNSKLDINLQITNLEDRQSANGEINLSDFSFKVKDITLPKNNARLVFKDNKVITDFNFNFIKNQFIKIKANADFSKNKYIEAKLTSTKIDLSDLKEVIDTAVKVFNIKLASSDIELKGTAGADLYLKSNFKTLTSKGSLKISDANLYHKKLKLTLDKINSEINFNNNKINIINTSASVNGSKFYLKGTIDEKTNLNISANSDLINISQILSLIQGLPIISHVLPELDNYTFKSGLIKINTSLGGNLKNPVIKTNSIVKDFSVFIKPFKSEFSSPEILISADPSENTIKEIFFKAKNSSLKKDKYTLLIPESNLKIKENDIVLSETPINFEGIKLNAKGLIKNYKSAQADSIIDLQGTIPSGNKFISFKTNTSAIANFNSKINLKNNNITINSFNLILGGKHILSSSGEIKNINNPELNNFRISIPERISIYSPAFDNLSFEAKGDINLSGNLINPTVNSNLNVYNFSYKPMKLYLGNIAINSKNSVFNINSTSSKISDFGFDFSANIHYKNKKALIDFIDINSNYIDLSKLQSEFKQLDLNFFEIKNIRGNVQTVEFGGFLVDSVKFDGSYKDYVLKVNNLSASAYDGLIQGSGTINLKNNKLVSDLVIKDIALRKLLSEINEIKKLSIAVSGHFSALIKSEIIIPNKTVFSIDDLIRNTEAYIKFNIDNGELAQFAKLERFLQAGNILSQSILKLSLNSLVSVVTKQNTGDFKTIEGTVKIYNSKADVQYIKSIGANMSMYITGKLNLLSQYAELNILGRIPISIVSVMGNFGKFTTQKLVDKMSEDSKEVVNTITASPIEKMLSTYATAEEIAKIPPLSIPNNNTREFKVNIFGPVNDTKSITNFKWLIQN